MPSKLALCECPGRPPCSGEGPGGGSLAEDEAGGGTGGVSVRNGCCGWEEAENGDGAADAEWWCMLLLGSGRGCRCDCAGGACVAEDAPL